jgi:hypothetical protein
MASVASQLIEEVTAHAQRDSLEDAREICADGTYFPSNLRKRISIRVCEETHRRSLSAADCSCFDAVYCCLSVLNDTTS